MLGINDVSILQAAIDKEKVNSEQRGFKWNIVNGTVFIEKIHKTEKNINADEVIRNMLNYAHEIESIN